MFMSCSGKQHPTLRTAYIYIYFWNYIFHLSSLMFSNDNYFLALPRRLFFDAIERSLLAVRSTNLINDLYRGEFVNQVKCSTCGCILLDLFYFPQLF